MLFLIDGVLLDMEDIKVVIIKVFCLFMLVIIVGVGIVDFKDMNEFDVDEGR